MPKPKQETIRNVVFLPKAVHKQLRLKAFRLETSRSKLILAAVEESLKKDCNNNG